MPSDVLATAIVQQTAHPLGTVAGGIRFTMTGPINQTKVETDLDALFLTLPNGTYTFTAVRLASNGTTLLGPTVSVQQTIPPPIPPPADTTPPVVVILEPADGAVLSGFVTIVFEATDNIGVVGSSVFVDNIEIENVHEVGTIWDSTFVLDGEHTIRAVALDAAGNEGEFVIVVTTHNQAVESFDELMAACVGA
jgi:hypothetical protein